MPLQHRKITGYFIKLFFSFLFLALLSRTISAGPTFTAPEPEDLMIYHVFIDRFSDGDPTNNNGNPRGSFNPFGGFDFHGGDIQGVRDNLDYIAGLGVNGIWLSPFVENHNDYHGYAAFDWYKVDPNFGDIDDLRALVDEANELGIAVYYDMVAGHMATLLTSDDFGYPGYNGPPGGYNMRYNSGLQYPGVFNDISLFHNHGHIGSFTAPEQELGELADLDDLDTENPIVQDAMTNVWEFWMEETGVSGFRVDTVKHVSTEFWDVFLPRLQTKAQYLGRDNYFTFGEVFGADDNFMATYLGTLSSPTYRFDSAVDFQYYYTSQNVFAYNSRPPIDLHFRIENRESTLGIHHLMMPNFIDNHDVPRFLWEASNNPGSGLAEQVRRLELALITMYMMPGPPIVYYGTEQLFNGSFDPQNRENMFDGEWEFGPSLGDNFDTSSPQYILLQRLTTLRRDLAPLRRGGYEMHAVDSSGPGEYVFSREHNGEYVITAINTSTNSVGPISINIPALANETLTDALDPTNNITVDPTGQINIGTLDGQAASIYVLTSSVPELPLSVSSISPVDGEVGVPIDLSFIDVTFSKEVDSSTSPAAFTINPPVAFDVTVVPPGFEVQVNLQETLLPETEYTFTVSGDVETTSGENLLFPVSATWLTNRAPIVLPPLPDVAGTLEPTTTAINVDGNDSDWPDTTSLARNESHFPDGKYIWMDALNDDTGAGAYLYPTNDVFTDGDSDIDRFGFTYDENNFYFLINQAEINPGASFFTSYYGIGLSTISTNANNKLGFHQDTETEGIAELLMREDVNLDFQIAFTGPRGADLIDHNGQFIQDLTSDFSQNSGIIEIEVPRSALDLNFELVNQEISIVVYAGLEVFGGMREVSLTNGNFEPGGGISSTTDPDIFDLIGASQANQEADLSDFTEFFESTLAYSLVRINLTENPNTNVNDFWIFE